MKRTAGIFLLIGSLLILPRVATAKLSIITEENPPFNYTQNRRLTGATVDVVREIVRRLGIHADIEVAPWARGYKRLQSEPDVVLFTTARTRERESLFQWVGPLYRTRLAFYARKADHRRIDGMDAAKKVDAIATYKDDYREQILKSLGFTNLDSSNSSQSNIRKLINGRVDLWFHDNIGAPKMAREAHVDPDAIEAVYTYQQYFSYIAISKRTAPDIAKQWQTTLDEMKADGTYWWLTRKWLPADAIMPSGRSNSSGQPLQLKLYTENSPPSSFVDNGRIAGLSVDIVQEILRRIGRQDTITIVPWARGYRLALSDTDTALFSTTRLPQRETRFAWVGPLYQQRWGFYRWKGRPVEIGDMDDARAVARIGTYHQDAKMQYLEAQGFTNLVPTNKNTTNVMHLQRGDIDLWVSSDFNMPHLVRQAGASPDQLELAYAFHTVGNYVAFSKQTSPHVIRLWQAVLDEMKTDGSYQRICHKYGYRPQ